MADPRGAHLGDGAYVVPCPYGIPDQVWLAANSHTNPVVAINAMAIEMMLSWLADEKPQMLIAALRSAQEQHQRAYYKLNPGELDG